MADPEPPTKKLRADTASPEPSQEYPSPSAATSPIPSDYENDNIIENVDELLEEFKSTLIEKYKNLSGLLAAICLMRKLPICYRCCVRHLCIRIWKIYSLSEERLHVFFTDFFRDALVEDSNHSALYLTLTTTDLLAVCTACLGTLQNVYTLGFIDPILRKLLLENYLVLDFNLCLTLPVGTLVRNHALGLHLTSQFKADNISLSYEPLDIVPLKEALRLMLTWELKEKTKLNFTAHSKFRITVTFDHAETNEEHIFLTQVDNTSVKIVKVRQKVHWPVRLTIKWVGGVFFFSFFLYGQKRKLVTVGDGRQRIVSTLKDIKPEVFAQYGKIPYPPVAIPAEMTKVEMMHESVYVAGFLTKGSNLPQAAISNFRANTAKPHGLSVIGGSWRSPYLSALPGRSKPTSGVTVCKPLILFWSANFLGRPGQILLTRSEPAQTQNFVTDCKFVSAGREDADVRMLGAGRPFYIELINPRSPQQKDHMFPIIQEEINTSPDASAVMVRHLLSVEE
ncbi:hypothetical protein BC937DRAFT_87272 [Endogone sp. FLAS-F59071]|nr:hypothetical protein BC937DRAFT_87272 [Endogone sp. FLAS-F59071]|eukprot:RUS19566.1 hypothetical protein BC937DRAFT_87272 [Endogone sp. FLAS-F59071]